MNCRSNYRHAAVVLKALTRATANRFLAKLDPALSQAIVMEMRRTRVTATNLREAIDKLQSEGIVAGGWTGNLAHTTGHATGHAADDAHGNAGDGSFPSGGHQDRHRALGDHVLRVDDGETDQSFGQRTGLRSRPNLDFSRTQTMRFEKDPFGFLAQYNDAVLDRLFDELKVRSAAVILSTLTFEFAAARLQLMDDSKKVSVIHAIADLEDLHPAEVIDLKFAVRVQIQQMVKWNPHLKASAIDAATDSNGSSSQDQSTTSVPSFAADTGGDADTSGESMAIVEQGQLIASLLEMPDHKVKQLLQTIDTTYLAPALKSCPVALQNKVLKNMSKKPAAVLSQQMKNVRIDQAHRISSSRHSIAAAIKKMQQQ